MLEYILNSSQRVCILRLLIRRPEWIFSESDIARELKKPKATIHRQIKTLAESNLLISYKKGTSSIYKINKKNFIVSMILEPLFSKEYNAVADLARIFCGKLKGTEVCIVFGSAMSGKMNPTSDIDIAIVAKKKLDAKVIEALKSEFLGSYGAIFSVHTFNSNSFKNRYKKGDPYIIDITNGLVIKGDVEGII